MVKRAGLTIKCRGAKYLAQQGEKYHALTWKLGLLTQCPWPWKQGKNYHGFQAILWGGILDKKSALFLILCQWEP